VLLRQPALPRHDAGAQAALTPMTQGRGLPAGDAPAPPARRPDWSVQAHWPALAALAGAALVGLGGLGGLAGCDNQRVARLEEGVSTEADVRREFGSPAGQHRRADGSLLLEYPRQPEGWTNYEITIGADGKMSALRQLLTPANFAKVQPGMGQVDVRRTLGRPAKVQTFAAQPGQELWEWRFMDGPQKKVFHVTFDRDRNVAATAIQDDPRDTMSGSGK